MNQQYMHRIIATLFLLMLSACHSSHLSASNPVQLHLSRSAVSPLLSQKTITTVRRDDIGFLWVGTQQGLYKYDGNQVYEFSSTDRSGPWIANSDIQQIEIGKNGDLWVATFGGGISKYDRIKNTFRSLSNAGSNDFLFVTSMLDTNDGTIWFGTRDSGIGAYGVKEHSKWLRLHPLNAQIRQPTDLRQHSSGEIWVGSATGLFLIEPDLKEITAYTLPRGANANNSADAIKAIELGTNDLLWLGTESGKILQFDLITRTFLKNEFFENTQFGTVEDISLDKNVIWAATDQGLIAIDATSSEIKKYTKNNSLLANDHVTTLFHDENTLWVGTYSGINSVTESSFEMFNFEDSGVPNEILSFTPDFMDRLWIGTYSGLYYQTSDSRDHHSFQSFYKNTEIEDQRIMSISAKGKKLWIGLRHNGVQVVDLVNGETYKQDFSGRSNLAITKILHANDGTTWIGTYYNGLFRVTNGESISLYGEGGRNSSKLDEQSITTIFEASAGRLIIGTEGGAYSYDPITTGFSPLKLGYEDKHIYPTILSIAQSKRGNIWIGTKDHGIFLQSQLIASNSHPSSPLKDFGSKLAGITAYSIEFDSNDHAWISTTNGLLEVDRDGELLNSYSNADGLQGNDFNFGASHKDSQGRLYFGGSNGYNRFHPDNIHIDSLPPPVVLTGLNIAGKTPELPVALQDLELIELAHEEYFITFIFSALDFLDPSKNQYSYKLENFDPEWIDNSTRNSATYTNLPPGEYTFRVRGANSAGVWNMEGASVRVRVLPSRWLTWWALMSYAIAIAVLVAVAKRFYDHRLIAKRATLDAKKMTTAANQASDDLQEQLEIQDDLVKSVHKHSVETLDWVRDIISLQANFFPDDSMRDAIESYQARILALGQLESCVFYQGDAVFADLNKYIDLVIGLALQSCPIPTESIVTTNEVSKRLVPKIFATPLAIITYELIHNCAQHAFANEASANYIQISLVATKTDPSAAQALTLSVQDNGIGMSENLSSQGADSAGLSIVNAIVEKLGGLIEIDRRSGTRVTITLPDTPDLLVL